jgi:probable rRNA maturation factor
LEEVVVTLVSDRRIDRIHRQFMDIPGATDVITFEHGEIVLSADTAQRCGAEFGHGTDAEAALYIVHGLLHLNGFVDDTAEARAVMHAVQERIWAACLPVS